MKDYRKLVLELINSQYDEKKVKKLNEEKMLREASINGDINICIFGAGYIGNAMYGVLKELGYKIKYFSDNNTNKHGKVVVDDIVCIAPDEIKNIKNVFVIIGLQDVESVHKQLKNMGINNVLKHVWEYFYEGYDIFRLEKDEVCKMVNEVFEVIDDEKSKEIIYRKIYGTLLLIDELKNFTYEDLYEKNIYYPRDIIHMGDNEVLVDCGAFDGDTLQYFINDMGINQFDKFICFELNKLNYERLNERIKSLPIELSSKIETYNYGVYDQREEISYYPDANKTNINNKGELVGYLDKIDNLLQNEKITYIKMDIEGSEVKAIKGAQKIIEENTPKMAVCVYHKLTDLLGVPTLLKKINPNYQVYIRHHSLCQNETVCYAVQG